MAAAVSAQAAGSSGAIWYSIVADEGVAIGFATSETAPRADGDDRIETQTIDIRDQNGFSRPVTQRIVTRRDRTGRTTLITAESAVGREKTRTVVRVVGRRAEIIRQTAADRRASSAPLPSGVRFDNGEALVAAWNPAVTPRLAFDAFELDALGVEQVTIEPAPSRPDDPPGAHAALRRRYEHGELRGVSRLVIDAEGRVVAVTQPLYGGAVTTRLASREAALAPRQPYAMLRAASFKSPFRISDSASRGHIRYRFGFRDGLAFAPPQTAEQKVVADAAGVTVDICGDCGPGLASDPATLAAALRPTAWLQSDDPRLRDLARPVARRRGSEARKMEQLAEIARPLIHTVDFAGHYSALETLKRGAGDCTEAAVLLAALGRAAGIPTRVADGLVYARAYYHGVSNVFMPHSWTLAYVDGRWRSFDMALDGFESTHIALTIGDGDARSLSASAQLASLLVWDRMLEVRTPAAAE